MNTPVFPSQSLAARLLRGAGVTTLGFVATQGLRFASNLILARLLFPEAFGLMALVSVVLVGAVMMSDAGIGQSVRQSPRGDDPVYLDTAWTMQVIRGAVLWAVVAALAWPAAWFFEAPELRLLLTVAGVTLFLAGLEPIKVDLAYRHLRIGRVTMIDLVAQVAGLVLMVVLAWVMRSVWALIVGMVLTSALRLALYHLLLPGRAGRLGWEAPAAQELFGFGIWIFLSSAFGFLLAQGDKLVFGRYLGMAELGLYNIAWFLASFPTLLAGALTGALLLPAYRIARSEGAAARARLFGLRRVLTAAILGALLVLVLIGPWIVSVLYDARYLGAGQILVWVALMQMWPLIGLTYDQAALAAGDSRAFFRVIALRASVQMLALVVGMHWGGLPGALAGLAIAAILVHPATIWIARRHGVWDPWHDLGAAVVATAITVAALGGG
jgi:O-antigen/teichoic acid export membrane protein